ncbi:MAG TPA: glycoside hydrolase family 11 protein [Polyangiaceae bacterium]|nr:glycoside hydrolase family 11 protein [Polyangiaceae bacterium]
MTGTSTATGMGGAGGSGGTPNNCPEAPPLSGGQEYCELQRKDAVGNGYGYELWQEGDTIGCMTVYGDEAAFGATWSNTVDFLARVGLDFNQTQTHSQIGNLVADFAETKTEEGGGLTYVGIYGWTVEPLIEYYILDDWGVTKPAGTASDGTPRTHEGTITADGATYDVYTKFREDKPAITGDSEDFYQYFSIRETARQCGRISISEHFSQWEELGLDLGRLHEAKWLVEAQDNSGSIEFTTATVVVE